MASAGREAGQDPAPAASPAASPAISPPQSPSTSPARAGAGPSAGTPTGPDTPTGSDLGEQPELARKLPFDDVRRPVAFLPVLTMRAGEIRMLEGWLTVRAAGMALQAAQIRCTDGESSYQSPYSTRNTPKDSAAPSTVRVRWLFAAPHPGTFRCGLYGHADRKGRPGYELRVQPAPATRIVVRDQPLRGALQWPVPHQLTVRPKATATLFRHGFEVVEDASWMRMETRVEVTDNYEGRRYDYDAVVTVELRVDQLDASGRPCGQAWTATARQRVTREVHHDKVSVVLDHVPVETTRACTRQFSAKATLHDVSGSPVTVHGPKYSDTTVEMLR